MLTNSQNTWWVRGLTFLVWVVAVASLVGWGLRLSASSSLIRPPAPVFASVDISPEPQAIGRLLGVTMAASPVAVVATQASRYALLGVVASRSEHGAALIAIDGKPPRPFRVGSRVDEGLILQAVEPRRARLGNAQGEAASMTLELPQPRH